MWLTNGFLRGLFLSAGLIFFSTVSPGHAASLVKPIPKPVLMKMMEGLHPIENFKRIRVSTDTVNENGWWWLIYHTQRERRVPVLQEFVEFTWQPDSSSRVFVTTRVPLEKVLLFIPPDDKKNPPEPTVRFRLNCFVTNLGWGKNSRPGWICKREGKELFYFPKEYSTEIRPEKIFPVWESEEDYFLSNPRFFSDPKLVYQVILSIPNSMWRDAIDDHSSR